MKYMMNLIGWMFVLLIMTTGCSNHSNGESSVTAFRTISTSPKYVSIRPTTGIKPLYTTIATVTINLIVAVAIVLLNLYVTACISY